MNEQQLIQAIALALKEHHVSSSNGNGNGNGNGANKGPWWSRSIWMLGPLAVIALLLVAQQAGLLKSPLSEDHARMEKKMDVEVYIMRAVCYGVNKDDPYTRSMCNPPPSVSGEEPYHFSPVTNAFANPLPSEQ